MILMIGGDGADRYPGFGDETVDGEVVMIWKRTSKQTEKTLYSVRVRVEFRVKIARRIIIIEARIKQKKVTCFVDGGAERSMISRALHEELELDANPYETTIMGVGGASTTVSEESKVLLRLGKKEKAAKALVCENFPIGDILLAADWLYEHSVTTTHRLPAIWFGSDKTTMNHASLTLTPTKPRSWA